MRMSCLNKMNKNDLRWEWWLSANLFCSDPCSENDPFLSTVLLFLLTCVLCSNSSFLTFFQLSLLCLFTLRCPLISSLRQDLSFSPLLIPVAKCKPHSTCFSPYVWFPGSCPLFSYLHWFEMHHKHGAHAINRLQFKKDCSVSKIQFS